MSLRIPLTKDQTLQTEFHEIERRLRKLERATGTAVGHTTVQVIGGGGGVSISDFRTVIERIENLEELVAGIGDPSEIPDFGNVGPAALRGLVPSPDTPLAPEGVAQHVLTEDNNWGFPFRGLVQVVTSGEQSDPPNDVLSIQASVNTGNLSAGEIHTSNVTVMGYLKLRGTFATCEDDLSVAGLI